MGTLITDTIVGSGSTNEVTLVNNKFTGTAVGNIAIPSEGGAKTTNVQQGLIKCWINLKANLNPPVQRDSFNQTTTTDNGSGDYTFNHVNPFSNTNYIAIGDVCNISSEVCCTFYNDDMSTSHFNGESRQRSDGGVQDTDKTDWLWAGDLA